MEWLRIGGKIFSNFHWEFPSGKSSNHDQSRPPSSRPWPRTEEGSRLYAFLECFSPCLSSVLFVMRTCQNRLIVEFVNSRVPPPSIYLCLYMNSVIGLCDEVSQFPSFFYVIAPCGLDSVVTTFVVIFFFPPQRLSLFLSCRAD